jgi:hypothetical protein
VPEHILLKFEKLFPKDSDDFHSKTKIESDSIVFSSENLSPGNKIEISQAVMRIIQARNVVNSEFDKMIIDIINKAESRPEPPPKDLDEKHWPKTPPSNFGVKQEKKD